MGLREQGRASKITNLISNEHKNLLGMIQHKKMDDFSFDFHRICKNPDSSLCLLNVRGSRKAKIFA